MPIRAPSICGCGRVVASGQRCACKVFADRQGAKAHDAKRGSARSRGYTSKWDKERRTYLAEHPTCVSCSAISSVVDHIVPHKGDMKLFWTRSNWQPLCQHCHCSIKQRQEHGSIR